MSDPRIQPQEQPDLNQVCQNLRNKKMSYLPLVQALDRQGFSPENGVAVLGTGSHSWCFRTQTGIGPDGGRVSLERCVAGRECHCPY